MSVLASALPVPLTAALPANMSRSVFAASVQLTELVTVSTSLVSVLVSTVVSRRLST